MHTFRRSKHYVTFAGVVALGASAGASAQDTGELLRRIAALEERLEKLEGAADGLTVTAPFSVRGRNGRLLFMVDTDDDSGSSVLRLYEPATGEAVIEASASAAYEAELLVGQEEKLAAGISVDAEGGSFAVFLNGNEVATLDGEDGAGSLELSDSVESTGVELSAEAGGSGFLELKADGEQTAVRLESGDETRLTINDDSGEAVVEAGPAEEGGGEVLVADGGRVVAVMAADSEGHGKFEIVADGKPLAIMDGGNNTGSLMMYDGSGAPAAWLTALSGGTGSLSLFRAEQLAAELGSDDGGMLRLYDVAGAVGVEATVIDSGEGAVFVGKQGNFVASMSVSNDGHGSFDVISEGNRLATMNGEGGNGTVLLRDGGGAPAVWITALPGGIGSVDLLHGEQVALQLGPGADAGAMALRVFEGTTQVAAIGRSPNDGGGALRIFGNGGEPRVSLDSFAAGGAVNVFGTGDARPVAAITADAAGGNGVVAVYNDGVPVAFLTRSSAGDGGNVTVALNDGFGVFSAGAAQDGAGEACVNRRTQAGTERLACVGLGLPSAGMGK